jgi:methionine-rich copper-binding protein CopC
MSPRARAAFGVLAPAPRPRARTAAAATRALAARVAFVVVVAAASSDAHAVLVRSSPAGRAAVATAPDRVLLWFNERLEPAFSGASVWSAAGVQVDRKDARVDPDDPKRLVVTLPPLSSGAYTVRYRVLSVDGHVVESSFSFTVRAPAAK